MSNYRHPHRRMSDRILTESEIRSEERREYIETAVIWCAVGCMLGILITVMVVSGA